jgi:hypothetical protein
MTTARISTTNWFPWVVISHWLLVVGGALAGPWLMVPLCLWTKSGILQLPGVVVWLALSLSPLLGLLAIRLRNLRRIYAGMAMATPLLFVLVFTLNSLGITQCDGP